jgi:hypothetical protein
MKVDIGGVRLYFDVEGQRLAADVIEPIEKVAAHG